MFCNIRIKTIHFFCLLFCLAIFPQDASAQKNGVAEMLYQSAEQNNFYALQNFLATGYDIDSVDPKGNTALCLALKKKDMATYQKLRSYGADANHPCVQKVLSPSSSAGLKGFDFAWTPTYTAGAIAMAAGVGVVALAGGGGGGGSSGESVSPKPQSADASDFETSEYMMGNFLPQINASSAYARFYTLDANGNFASNLKDVKVGIIDTGLYAQNTDFADTQISGINRAYGPCGAGQTTNCWIYEGGQLKFANDLSQRYNLNQTTYDKWAARYENYDWEAEGENGFGPINEAGTHRHGTHVSGIIAADKNDSGMHGVAFSNAELIAARWDYMYAPGKIISDLVAKGVRVINMSFSSNAESSPASMMNESYYQFQKSWYDKFIVSGVLEAAQNDVAMVMSAGNEGNAEPGLYSGLPNVNSLKGTIKNLFITVVSTDSNGQINDYSNRCGSAKDFCIAAPGGTLDSLIISTGTYDIQTYGDYGTSMSAPVVTGSIALLAGAYPYLSTEQIVSLIFESANKTGEYANAQIYGQGMLDLNAATNPQGYLATMTESSVQGASFYVNQSSLEVPVSFQEAILENLPQSMAVFDKYNRPFDMPFSAFVHKTHGSQKNFKNDFGHFMHFDDQKEIKADHFSFRFTALNSAKSDFRKGFAEVSYHGNSDQTSVFFSQNTLQSMGDYEEKAMINPYLAFNEAYGLSHSRFFDKISLKTSFIYGQNGLYDGDKAYHDNDFDQKACAFGFEMSYQMAPKFELGLMTGLMTEDEAALGLNGKGAFGFEKSQTYYTGFALKFKPMHKLTLSGAFYQGYTGPTAASGSMVHLSRLKSRSFAFDAQYRSDKASVFGFQISSPLKIERGYADFDVAIGRDDDSDKIYRQHFKANLKNKAREYKFALYHNRQINEDIAFKSEIATRFHPEHQKDAANDYRALLGLFVKF